MTLQELIGELNTLALAYPAETPIAVKYHEYTADVVGLVSVSDSSTVTIVIETQS